jgi:hypothetical protein
MTQRQFAVVIWIGMLIVFSGFGEWTALAAWVISPLFVNSL